MTVQLAHEPSDGICSERPIRTPLFTTRLRGITFVGGYPDIYVRLAHLKAIGCSPRLEIVAEPDHPIDPDAVAVRSAQTRRLLGYLPAPLAHRLVVDLDRDLEWAIIDYGIDLHRRRVCELDGGGERRDAIGYRPSMSVTLQRIQWIDDETLPRVEPLGSAAQRRSTPPNRGRQMLNTVRRAREAHLRCVEVGEDIWAVQSSDGAGFYQVVVDRSDPAHPLYCTCRGGVYYGSLAIPCVHSATVGLRAGVIDARFAGSRPADAR